MTWRNSIKLDVANLIFAPIEVQFIKTDVEGGYLATSPTRSLRRPTLIGCCIAVMSDWVMLKHD